MSEFSFGDFQQPKQQAACMAMIVADSPIQRSSRIRQKIEHEAGPEPELKMGQAHEMPALAKQQVPETQPHTAKHPNTRQKPVVEEQQVAKQQSVMKRQSTPAIQPALANLFVSPGPGRASFSAPAAGAVAKQNRTAHWVQKNTWPESAFEPSSDISQKIKARLNRSSRVIISNGEKSKTEDSQWESHQDPNYPSRLAQQHNVHMTDHVRLTPEEATMLESLSTAKCGILPAYKWSLNPHTFRALCRSVSLQNKEAVVRVVAPLLVPPASSYHILGRNQAALDILAELMGGSWQRTIPLTDTEPAPDYTLGFHHLGFSKERRYKLEHHLHGDLADKDLGPNYHHLTRMKATHDVLFPFLVVHAHANAEGPGYAERLNMHAMAIALRGIVGLFAQAGRKRELNGKTLGFSVTHDSHAARLHAYYVTVENDKMDDSAKITRHQLRHLDFEDKKEAQHTSLYTFTTNLYKDWVPKHYKFICSAVDALRDLTLENARDDESMSDAVWHDLVERNGENEKNRDDDETPASKSLQKRKYAQPDSTPKSTPKRSRHG